MELFISTSPFGESDPSILEPLRLSGISWSSNTTGRKLKPEELLEAAKDCKALVAGTENLSPLLKINPNLKMIARVGIGLDGVPLHECRRRRIRVSWTPDAVTQAVAELTLGLMLCTTRHVRSLDECIRRNQWSRRSGRGIGDSVIGLLGFGRIGSAVASLLLSFHPKEVVVRDIVDKTPEIQALKAEGLCIRSVSQEELIKSSHVLSIHVPLWKETHQLIGKKEFDQMQPDAVLINTARGGIVDEDALDQALELQMLAGAAIDVFEQEPYSGPLTLRESCLLTPHLGSCTLSSRTRMESEALNETLRWLRGKPLEQEVPDEEYAYQE